MEFFITPNTKFALLQEAINYEIYRRWVNQPLLTDEQFDNLHEALDELGNSEAELDTDDIRLEMYEFQEMRMPKDPEYQGWIWENDYQDNNREDI